MSSEKACVCGNQKFYGSQVCYHDIIVDEYGNFIENVGIGESDKPYGFFTCTNCDAVYDDLDDLPEIEEANLLAPEKKEKITTVVMASELCSFIENANLDDLIELYNKVHGTDYGIDDVVEDD